ncbi:DJ-1/PfpI family protein [Filimonas lacunae]|nr:DJ-1/PfpI family protein [Filimonas lacunae]BAV07619.1 catalase [Filimonas lacunae]
MPKTPVPNKTIAKKTTLKKRNVSTIYKTVIVASLPEETETENVVLPLITRLLDTNNSYEEKTQLVDAICMQLRNLPTGGVRESLVRKIAERNKTLAAEIAYAIRLHTLKEDKLQESIDADEAARGWYTIAGVTERKTPLSTIYHHKTNIRLRRVAILAADGVHNASLQIMKNTLLQQGAEVEIVAPEQGLIVAEDNSLILVGHSLERATPLYYDAVYVAGGKTCVAALLKEVAAIRFLNETYRHGKAIALNNDALPLIAYTSFGASTSCMDGVVTDSDIQLLCGQFIEAIGQHRFWNRFTHS